MCTYLTNTTEVVGAGLAADGWFDAARAVVYFDHPQEARVEHALCIDVTGPDGDPSRRVALELDAASARRLAETILATLDDPEVRELTEVVVR